MYKTKEVSKKLRKLEKTRAKEAEKRSGSEKLHKAAEAEIEKALQKNRVDVENILTPDKEKTE